MTNGNLSGLGNLELEAPSPVALEALDTCPDRAVERETASAQWKQLSLAR